jgi:hypothetical protein
MTNHSFLCEQHNSGESRNIKPGDSIPPEDSIGKDQIRYQIAMESGIFHRKTDRIRR